MAKIIISGANGQDGHLLAKLHISKGDTVFGISKSKKNHQTLVSKDYVSIVDHELINDRNKLTDLIGEVNPKLFYHLASAHGPSGTMGSVEGMNETLKVGPSSTKNISESIVASKVNTGLIVALSSRMYSENLEKSINEDTPVSPADYYGEAKAQMREIVSNYRTNEGLNGGSAILFNHDSIYKARGYLAWDISEQVASVIKDTDHKVNLRNPYVSGDFSHAEDICQALYLQGQKHRLTDYVLGDNKSKLVTEIVEQVALNFGVQGFAFAGSKQAVQQLPYSNTSKAIQELKWRPTKTFEDAIIEMTKSLLFSK